MAKARARVRARVGVYYNLDTGIRTSWDIPGQSRAFLDIPLMLEESEGSRPTMIVINYIFPYIVEKVVAQPSDLYSKKIIMLKGKE